VPAADVIHLYKKKRPGQDRGVTEFAPVVIKLRDLDVYDDAELIRKQIAATQVMAVTSPESGSGATPVLGSQTTETGTNARLEKMRPGMIARLRPGESVEFNSPPSDGNYPGYVSVQLHAISSGLKIPYELLTGDFSQVNYSSFRGAMLEFRRTVQKDQWLTFVPGFCDRVWAWFVEAALAAGKLPRAAYPVKWQTPKFEMIDPLKDAQADQLMIRTGTKTLPQAIAEQGYDPDEQIAEIAETNAALDAAKIVLDCDPRKTARAGTAQADPTQPNPKEPTDANNP
jgi:lambda family phage portal protein